MSRRLALIIGNSVYRDETLTRLQTPDADIGDLADIFNDPEVGAFDDVKLLINVTSTLVRREISNFYSRKRKDDLLFLYFSGHGVLDDRGRLYLAVKDTEANLLRGTAISSRFISDEMDNSRSQRQVLVLDCCHSGAFARGTKGKTGASVGTSVAFEGTGYGRVVMTASDATQYAWEGDKILGAATNSLFTHYLIQGLKSGAADANLDGEITIDELYDYVYEKVVKQSHKQTPGKWSYKEQGDIVIAKAPVLTRAQQPLEPGPDTQSELDDQLEQRLEKIYLRGLTAYHVSDWAKASDYFSEIVRVRETYKDAQAKLEESNQQIKWMRLYKNALIFINEAAWSEALQNLEALIKEVPDYLDVRARLAMVKRKKRSHDLYSEAVQLYEAGAWQAAANAMVRLEEFDPDYPDPAEIRAAAERRLAEEDKKERLLNLYKQALAELDAGRLRDGRQFLLKIQEIDSEYEGTRQLLRKIEAELKVQEQKKELARQPSTAAQQRKDTDQPATKKSPRKPTTLPEEIGFPARPIDLPE